jgi:hypothetical protein
MGVQMRATDCRRRPGRQTKPHIGGIFVYIGIGTVVLILVVVLVILLLRRG